MATSKKPGSKKTAGKKKRQTTLDVAAMLKNLKYKHLSDKTLNELVYGERDEMLILLTRRHLEMCLVCSRRLEFLKEEK